jgi:threonine/homoserine/homoserine lactone efflux protein
MSGFVETVFGGYATGFVLSLMLGTVFFILLRNSVQYGFRSGLLVATGVILSDVLMIAVAVGSHGVSIWLSQENVKTVVVLIAGNVLLFLGIYLFFFSGQNEQKKVLDWSGSKRGVFFISQGFSLNIINPVNFFGWIAISTMLTVKYDYSLVQKIVFFVSSLAANFINELLITYFARKIKPLATPTNIKRINQISGLVFFIAGIKLLFFP